MLPSDLDIFSPREPQHAVVHPDAREALARGLRLRALVLVVREDQVEAAAVDVEVLAELRVRHRRALDVPAGPPAAPGRVPGRVLIRLVGLPEREVERRALALARLDARAGDQLVGPLARELAVARIGRDAEVDVAVGGRRRPRPRSISRSIRSTISGIVSLASGSTSGRPRPRRVGVRAIGGGHPRRRAPADGTPCSHGRGVDLVVDVGDVDRERAPAGRAAARTRA